MSHDGPPAHHTVIPCVSMSCCIKPVRIWCLPYSHSSLLHTERSYFFCKFHTTLVVYTPVFCQYFWHHLAHCFFLQISEAILTRSLKMQNEAGEYVDLYIPRYGVVRVYAFACCTFYALLYLSMTVTLWTSSALLIHTSSTFYARLAWLFSRLTRAWFTPGDINKSNILNGYFLNWNFYIRFRYR